MFYSDDPAADFSRKDAAEERWLKKRPICEHCGKHIQDERVYVVYGEYYHVECFNDEHLKWTEDYIE